MTIQTSHNGGRTQCDGSSGGPFSASYPFMNLLKGGRIGIYKSPTVPVTHPDPPDLDANGYPTVIAFGGIQYYFPMPPQADRPGDYVLLADGDGTMTVDMTHTPVGGSLTASGGSLRYRFTPGAGITYPSVSVTARGTDYLKNIRVVHIDDEARLAAGEIFNRDYLRVVKDEFRFGVIRNLDAMEVNTSNITKWTHRTPVTCVSYEDHFPAALWAGSTSGTSSAYTASKSGFVLEDGATIMVRWHVDGVPSGTGNDHMTATLNVQGTGTKPILSVFGNDTFFKFLPAAGLISTLVYKSDLDGYMLFVGNNVAPVTPTYTNRGIQSGWPPEIFVELAAQLGAHPWFVTPYLATGPNSDYNASLMAMLHDYIVDNNIPWMIPRIEPPNEQWNPQFPVYSYDNIIALIKWGSGSNNNDMYNWRTATLGQQALDEWGGDTSKYWIVGGVQTYFSGVPVNRFSTSGKNVTVGGGAAARTKMSHLAIANYWDYSLPFDPGLGGAAVEIALADDYDAASTDAQRDAIVDEFCQLWNTVARTAYLGQYQEKINYAATIGVGVTLYEGGYGADYGAYGAKRDALKAAAKMHWRTRMVAQEIFDWLTARGAEFPSHFQISGVTVWGAILDNLYGARTPSAQQLSDCAQHKRTIYLTLS